MKKIFTNILLLTFFVLTVFSPIFAASPGALDPTFGFAGVSRAFGTDLTDLNDIAVGNDGKVVGVGRRSNDFFVTRFTATGKVDVSLTSGFSQTDFNGGNDTAGNVQIQTDGKMIVVGISIQNSQRRIALARYNPDGSLDNTFGTQGKVVLASNFVVALTSVIKIQADGKYVLNCQIGNQIGVVRLLSNGTLDTTFDGDGSVTTNLGATTSSPYDLAIQQDGKIVVVGARNINQDSFILRYNTNGTLDTTFNVTGSKIINYSPNSDFLMSLAIQQDGKIVAVGNSSTATIVSRFLSNGNFDSTFIGGGTIPYNLDTVNNEWGTGIHIMADGRMIVVTASAVSPRPLLAARLNQNGSLDQTFAKFGILRSSNLSTSPALACEVKANKLVTGFKMVEANGISFEKYDLSKSATAVSDFDGDGITDTAVFRPNLGQWFVLRSTDNSLLSATFGQNGDVPIDGDFDGDGRSDLAVFRPSNGLWSFQRSSDNTNFSATFGNSTDKPLSADLDKDGKSDIAVFRPSTGEWLSLTSASNFTTLSTTVFGQNGDIPISSERK